MKRLLIAASFLAFLACMMSCTTFVYNSAFINQTTSPTALVIPKSTETSAKFGVSAGAFVGSVNAEAIGGDLGIGLVWGSRFPESIFSWNVGLGASALLAQVIPKWVPAGVPPKGTQSATKKPVLFAVGARGQVSSLLMVGGTDSMRVGLGPEIGFCLERGSYFDKRPEYQQYSSVDALDYFGTKIVLPVKNTSETGMTLTARLTLQTIYILRNGSLISVGLAIGSVWPSFPYSPLLSIAEEQTCYSMFFSYQAESMRFWAMVDGATVPDGALSFKLGTEVFLASTAE